MPPLISQPIPTRDQADTFVGRVQELSEFRASVHYLLDHEQSPQGSDYPHIFLVHGEGGMGKSALLYQFEKIARQEGMQNAQIIRLGIESQQLLTTEALAQALSQVVRQKNPDFDQRYRSLHTQREALLSHYNRLRKQWASWEALRGSGDENLEDIEQKYRQLWNKSEEQRAQFGTLYEPVHLIAQSENALEALAALRDFRNTQGHTPPSFNELLRDQLGQEGADIWISWTCRGSPTFRGVLSPRD